MIYSLSSETELVAKRIPTQSSNKKALMPFYIITIILIADFLARLRYTADKRELIDFNNFKIYLI